MTASTPLAQLLLQAASDSATTRIVVENGWLANLASIGQGLVSILVAVMLLMVVLMLFALKKSLDELTRMVKNTYEPVQAVLKEARDVTAEVKAIALTVKEPVTRLAGTVDDASGRVRAAMARAETRLERVDRLAGVVQDQAESLVIRSASMARGLRVGGAALRAVLLAPTARRDVVRDRPVRSRRRADVADDRNAKDVTNGARQPGRPAPKDGEGPRIRPRSLPAR